VTSVTTVLTKDVVSYVEVLGFLMRITARNALSKKKIETVVRKLSIWAAVKRIYFTKGRNMDLRKDSYSWNSWN
jgi:hypothetical protein